MKYPFTYQHDERDCGAACLSMICEYYGKKLPIARFRELIKVDNQGANIYGIVTGAKEICIDADALSGTFDELSEEISTGNIKFPFIARIVNEKMYEHFIVVYGMKKGRFIVGDPAKKSLTKLKVEDFGKCWQGEVIVFSPTSNFVKGNERKCGLKKYFRYIAAQKQLLAIIFCVSIIITGINLSSTVFFQYVLHATVDSYEEELHEGEKYEHEHEHVDEDEEDSDNGTGLSTVAHVSPKLDHWLQKLNVACTAIIVLYVIQALLQILRSYILAVMAKKIDVPITMNYYGHLMKLPFSFFGTRRTGEFMSRFSDTDKIRKAVSSATLAVMLDSITAIGCGILLYKISDKLFLIILGVLVVYFLITLLFRKPIKDINHELMENESQVNSYLKESIDGIETVKAYQLENNTINKTKNMYEELTDKYVKGSTIYSVRNSLVNFVHSAGVVSVLWIGSLLCGKGVLDIIDLLTVYYLMGMFIEPVENIINLQPEIQTAIVAAERLDDITESAVENNYALMSSTEEIKINNIEIKNIDFTYGNRRPVLEDINIKIPKGKKIAVIGESGCGKTTIAKLLLSFYDATNGMIEIDGKNISDIPKSVIRNRIAYISQNTFMFSDSILNNIILENDSINENDFENICEKCSIDEFVNKMPLGYLTNLEENGTNISGGQRQRIAIARALLKRPDVLIMDEATSNLDIATEREIIETVYNTDYDLTCVIIAHRLETIINCDYVYVMREGKIVKSGIPSDILEAV